MTLSKIKDGGGIRGAEAEVKFKNIRDSGFEPHFVIQVLKKQNVTSPSFVHIQYCGEPSFVTER